MSQVAQQEGLLSKKNLRLLSDPLNDNNPVTVQILGVCSALAVTTKLAPSVVMAISVTVVTAMSNLMISALRNTIPSKIRMIVQLVVVAAVVTIVGEFLEAYTYALFKQLSVFIGLIITNCIVMGRLEAYAMANKPYQSFLDGIGNGLGYGAILITLGFFRELFGSGTLFNIKVMPQSFYDAGYVNNGVMLTPAAAMFLIGGIIWIQRSKNRKLIDIS